ncbi:YaaA family protein [Georgenia sp.]
MLLLLPPSEGKTPPRRGAPLDLAALSAPDLMGAREGVMAAVADASRRPDAVDVLGIGMRVADELTHNTTLRTAPTAPAARVYTGVLHAAAGLAGLRGAAARRAADDVLIFSGLWGVLSPADRIPAYRLSMGVTLPGVGRLSTYWRDHLGAALDERVVGDVVVDCRSATYAAAWQPPSSAEHVLVQVVRESGGRRQVVSHNAKHARGHLTHHLLARRGRTPRTVAELAAAAQGITVDPGTEAGRAVGAVHAVELAGPERGRWTLTLIERV